MGKSAAAFEVSPGLGGHPTAFFVSETEEESKAFCTRQLISVPLNALPRSPLPPIPAIHPFCHLPCTPWLEVSAEKLDSPGRQMEGPPWELVCAHSQVGRVNLGPDCSRKQTGECGEGAGCCRHGAQLSSRGGAGPQRASIAETRAGTIDPFSTEGTAWIQRGGCELRAQRPWRLSPLMSA